MLGRSVPVRAGFLGRLYQRTPGWKLSSHGATNGNVFSHGCEGQMSAAQLRPGPVPPGASVLGVWTRPLPVSSRGHPSAA